PKATALVYPGRVTTYAELNAKANQLAHYLRKEGIKPGTPVGICVERTAEMIIGILGILKAGGAYLPLDTTYPGERLVFMAKDAVLPVILTQKKLAADLKFDCKVVCFDR